MVVRITTVYAIITEVVSSNHAHGEVYSVQHYAIQFINDLRWLGLWCFNATLFQLILC